MINSTYLVDRWQDITQDKVAPSSIGVTGSCPAASTTNIDLTLTDDYFFRGIEVLTQGGTFGDTITFQVIDSSGIVSPPGTVLLTPATNWNVQTDVQAALSYESIVPKKALATFTLRIAYTNTGLIGSASVRINYILLKVLM